jgi:acid phosphatase (class A)
VVGGALDREHRPLTRALLDEAEAEARQVYWPLKKRFARPRPYDADPRVAPAIAREPSFAFPSGHAVRGTLYARLLAELAPARREGLLERGRRIGFDRVLGGVHWPSDVEAGQRLGEALADALLARPGLRAQLERARAVEWIAQAR